MAKLSKLDAAKAVGVSRQTLYTYLKDGRLSADADGLIDTAELLRAGFTLHTIGRQGLDTTGHDLTSNLDSTGHRVTSNLGTLDVYLDMIAMLKQQLSEAQVRELAALEREKNARTREDLLLQMIQEMQHRYDRLLNTPRPPALPRPAPRRPLPPRGEACAQRETPLTATAASTPRETDAASQGAAFDPTRFVLGRLCPRGHAYGDTGQTLRRVGSGGCPSCDVEQQRERRRGQRPTQAD